MSGLPRTVKHQYTGETITFLETMEETDGEYLFIQVSLPPRVEGPPLHIHQSFTEEFEVLQGKLTLNMNKIEKELDVGQKVLVSRGMAHTYRNAHDELVKFKVKLVPPGGFEQSVRIHYGLMDDGLTDELGDPKSIFHTIKIIKLQDTMLADKPVWLQRILFGIIVGIGKVFGRYRNLDKYIQKQLKES